MMWAEFEELAGYRVSYEDYSKVIEPMYMAVNMDKKDFIKCIDKKRFALPTKQEMKKEMRKIANVIFEKCGHTTTFDEEEEIDKLAKKYAKIVYGLDWDHDPKVYVYFLHGYEYEPLQRGCTYPKELVIKRDDVEYERIALVKTK